MNDQVSPTDIGCTLTDEAFRERRAALREQVVSRVTEIHRTVSSLFVVLPESAENRAIVARYAELERQCCGFLTFTLRRPGKGLVLTVTGPPEASRTLDFFAAVLADREK